MKLQEVVDWSTIEGKGVYSGVRFSPATVKELMQYSKQHKIPNPLQKDEYHCTVLYSRRPLPNFKPLGKFDIPLVGISTGFEVWPNRKKTKNILVMTISCPELYQHYHMSSLKHGVPSDYDQYNPHISLSYEAGEFEVGDLPEFTSELEIIEEYVEELDE